MRHLAVLLCSLLVLAACGETSSSSSSGTSAPTSEATPTSGAPEPPRGAAVDGVVVAEVVDGDTIRVERDGDAHAVRLIGVNAPERDECLADEAGRWLRDRVAGREVELVRDVTDQDRYGRLLRYVEVDGADVGEELVRAGLALAREYPPDTDRSDVYSQAQEAAEEAGVGMWGGNACGVAPSGADVAVTEIRLDADGDDNQNLNDEWVRITNRGGAPLDLTGWVLKDTSASHRYSFPTGFTLDAGATVTVRTGCGADSGTDLHWCNEGSAVWNNSGDTAFLLDPAGNIVSSLAG